MKMQLMHEEVYYVPRYRWWQGWLEPKRIELVDDEEEPDGHAWQWKGDRLRNLHVTDTFWGSNGIDDWSWEKTEFCGWDELLHPKNRRTRMVPVGELVDVPFKTSLVDGLSWGPVEFPHPGLEFLEANFYDDQGLFLFMTSMTQPIPAAVEGDRIELKGTVTLLLS